jgi:hypothetical protein
MAHFGHGTGYEHQTFAYVYSSVRSGVFAVAALAFLFGFQQEGVLN